MGMKKTLRNSLLWIIMIFMSVVIMFTPATAYAANSAYSIKNPAKLTESQWDVVYSKLGTAAILGNKEFSEGENAAASFIVWYLFLNGDFEAYDNYEENGYGTEITFAELTKLANKYFLKYNKNSLRAWINDYVEEGAEYGVSKYDKKTDTYYFSMGIGGWVDFVLSSVSKVGNSYILKGKYYAEGKFVQDMQFLIVNSSAGYKIGAYGKRVVAKTTGLKVTQTGTNQIKLSWNKQPNIKGYKVYRVKNGKYTLVKTLTGSSATSCTVSNLAAGYGYNFKVRAYTGSKPYYGAYSNLLSTPTKPAKVTLNSIATGSSHYVKASWKKCAGSGYNVVIATNTKFTAGKQTVTVKSNEILSKKFSNLKKGKTYYVKVRAYKTFGGKTQYGQWSEYKYIKCK